LTMHQKHPPAKIAVSRFLLISFTPKFD